MQQWSTTVAMMTLLAGLTRKIVFFSARYFLFFYAGPVASRYRASVAFGALELPVRARAAASVGGSTASRLLPWRQAAARR